MQNNNIRVSFHYHIKSALFGLAIGDALGVPVEFESREYLKLNPVTDMIGNGTYNQPPGTWSDDSSLTFCLTEGLINGYDINRIGEYFKNWLNQNFWTAHGEVFDVGITTENAIERLQEGCKPELAGGAEESDNGNGSLMRILPLVFYLDNKSIFKRFTITQQVSSITHRHIRSVIACFYYLEFARKIWRGKDKFKAYEELKKEIPEFLENLDIPAAEIEVFNRLLNGNISEKEESEINSSGYVLHTLEASIWCLLTSDNYQEAVLKAVNLGGDTDTTAAVTGGLVGILYGYDTIPENWIKQLARNLEIENLSLRYALINLRSW
jgi:ADP-ribosyl-[dinitrogen reductase] hydrolase